MTSPMSTTTTDPMKSSMKESPSSSLAQQKQQHHRSIIDKGAVLTPRIITKMDRGKNPSRQRQQVGSFSLGRRVLFVVLLSLLVMLTNLEVCHAADSKSDDVETNNNNNVATSSLPYKPSTTVVDGITAVGDWEYETGFYQGIAVENKGKPLFIKQSKYQLIEIYQSKGYPRSYYGKMLFLDKVLQLTEKDADSYNEMMAHIPLMQLATPPKKVLIIGGGDGYVLNEVLKHPSIEHVDFVDIDIDVVEACKQYFPITSQAFDNSKVSIHIMDGNEFIQNTPSNTYDVIIQDSSDPWTYEDFKDTNDSDSNDGEKATTEESTTSTISNKENADHENIILLPSSQLVTKEHFQQIYRILKPHGIFNFQAECFQIESDLWEGIVKWRQLLLSVGFHSVKYGSLYISSYTTGQIGFMMCEKSNDEVMDDTSSSNDTTTIIDPSSNTFSQERMVELQRRFDSLSSSTSYYQPKLQTRYV